MATLGALAVGVGFPRGNGALVGALAAAAADTFASEIGVRSTTPPRSIVTGRVVRPGTSGGVTSLGWLASALGALLVAVSYAVGGRGRPGWRAPLLAALSGGLLGCLADSLAGATVQAAYRCSACGSLSESPRHACGGSAVLVGGYRWVTNDGVNLLGTLVGGVVGASAWPSGGCATLGRRRA